ncbi:hypothetical protein Glove_271g18 [Diversispora epigaea]|uniref:Uncharacterized protein n=1 Tax=Diversispora epigaea TaxID=1348612 RepID=A0A397I5K6_9GLOM|nr:hypothetical protein Glove_271g18 [Diversispora epigaea]
MDVLMGRVQKYFNTSVETKKRKLKGIAKKNKEINTAGELKKINDNLKKNNRLLSNISENMMMMVMIKLTKHQKKKCERIINEEGFSNNEDWKKYENYYNKPIYTCEKNSNEELQKVYKIYNDDEEDNKNENDNSNEDDNSNENDKMMDDNNINNNVNKDNNNNDNNTRLDYVSNDNIDDNNDGFPTYPSNNTVSNDDENNPKFSICLQTQLNDVCMNELTLLTLEKYRIPVETNNIYGFAHKFDYENYYNKYLEITKKKDNDKSSEDFKKMVLEEINKNDMKLTEFIEYIGIKNMGYQHQYY